MSAAESQAAYFLSCQGHPCTLIEAQPHLGGMIRTEQLDGCVVEAGPDSFVSQKPWALEIVELEQQYSSLTRSLLHSRQGRRRPGREISDWDEKELAHVVHQELIGLMGFRPEPVAWRVHCWDLAMAQYEVGHQKRLEEIEARLARLPGLHLTGNGYIGVGIPDCVRRSRIAAERVVKAAAAAEA